MATGTRREESNRVTTAFPEAQHPAYAWPIAVKFHIRNESIGGIPQLTKPNGHAPSVGYIVDGAKNLYVKLTSTTADSGRNVRLVAAELVSPTGWTN